MIVRISNAIINTYELYIINHINNHLYIENKYE